MRHVLILGLIVVSIGVLAFAFDGRNADMGLAQSSAQLSPPDPTSCLAFDDVGTSADYLNAASACLHPNPSTPSDLHRRALLQDFQIKAWSYSHLNKLFFWLSLSLAIAVLLWPTLAPILREAAEDRPTSRLAPWQRIAGASGTHTTITALAALSFALYAHYKSSQAQTENLMRLVFYAETVDETLVDTVVARMAAIDTGFQFSLGD